jgi:hypothetical protein
MKTEFLYTVENFPYEFGVRRFIFNSGPYVFLCVESEHSVSIEKICFKDCFDDSQLEKYIGKKYNLKEKFLAYSFINSDGIVRNYYGVHMPIAEERLFAHVAQCTHLINIIRKPNVPNKIDIDTNSEDYTELLREEISSELNGLLSGQCEKVKWDVSINFYFKYMPLVTRILALSNADYSIFEPIYCPYSRNYSNLVVDSTLVTNFNIHIKQGVDCSILGIFISMFTNFGLKNIYLVDDKFNTNSDDSTVIIGMDDLLVEVRDGVHGCLSAAYFKQVDLQGMKSEELIERHYNVDINKINFIDRSQYEGEPDFDEPESDDWFPIPKWNDFNEDVFDGQSDASWNID